MRIGVIGAGLSALTFASRLHHLHDITLFEKSRGVGGRMSTRYTEHFQFDHGAQYFTVRDANFSHFLASFFEDDTVQPWNARFASISAYGIPKPYITDDKYFVASPKMNALCKRLSKDINVLTDVHIDKVDMTSNGRFLIDKVGQRHGPFDWIISTAPVAQSIALMPANFSELAQLKQAEQQACIALMLGFEEPLPVKFDGIKVFNSSIGWICVDSTKPDRNKYHSVVVHSTNEWAEKHINLSEQELIQLLSYEFKRLIQLPKSPPILRTIHKWRYANTLQPVNSPYLIDRAQQIGVCGDACVDGRVEGAFRSAYELSEYFTTDCAS